LSFSQVKNIPSTNVSGKTYYLSFPPAYLKAINPELSIKLYVHSEFDQKITYSNDLGIHKTINVTADEVGEFSLTPYEAQALVYTYTDGLMKSGVFEGSAIKVSGEKAFQLTGVVRYPFTTDGTMFLPYNKLGTEYICSGYSSRPLGDYGLPSLATVVGTEDNTIVEVTIGGNVSTQITLNDGTVINSGETHSFKIDKGDVLLLATSGGNQTLSGTKIKSNNKVNVISGQYCADIPVGNPTCDYNIAQNLPMDNWGKNFVIPYVENQAFPSILRIFAKEDNTKIYRDGVEIAVINKGDGGLENENWIEQRVYPKANENAGKNAFYSSDKPISISFYKVSNLENQNEGVSELSDPFQVTLSPIKNYVNILRATIPGRNPGPYFSENYSTVITEADENGEIPKDIYYKNSNTYTQLKNLAKDIETVDATIDSKDKKFLVIRMSHPEEGSYKYESDSSKIGGIAYGYHSFDSYGFDMAMVDGTSYDSEEDGIIETSILSIASGENSQDYLFMEYDVFYKNLDEEYIDLNFSKEPFDMNGQRNENIVDIKANFLVDDVLTDEQFTVSFMSDGELLEESIFEYKAPKFIASFDNQEIESSIELGNAKTESIEFRIQIDNNDAELLLDNSSIDSKYFEIGSAEQIDDKVSVKLNRISDFETDMQSNIILEFNYGISKEYTITGNFASAAFSSNDEINEEANIGEEINFQINLENFCDNNIPITKELIINGINIISDKNLNINFDETIFPLSINPYENYTIPMTASSELAGNYETAIEFEVEADEICNEVSKLNFIFKNPSSVKTLPNNFLKISPNPAENILELSLQDNFKGNIKIFDINGNIILASRISGNSETIDVSGFAAGTYFIEISNNESKITKQFVKN
jgi:hypothetical protein